LLREEELPMKKPKEGEIFKIIKLHGKSFELRYGYYEDYERESEYGEPIPIYPDFLNHPQYSDDGYPFATQMQDRCCDAIILGDGDCCADCVYYHQGEELLGLCKCDKKRLPEADIALSGDIDSREMEDTI
jgi:hypothetical protein